jgi:hypothetical protein
MHAKDISEVLKHFDNLPDTARIPRKAVALITGESESTLRRDDPGIAITQNTRGYTAGWVRARMAERRKLKRPAWLQDKI